MRRYDSPFNGLRFLLNSNTGEIHDLDNETDFCHIDDIKHEHIHMTDSYDEAQAYAVIVESIYNPNGCHFCIPYRDNG